MAIEFARPRFIQRSKGHNVVQVAAYNMRDRLWCEMTGRRTAAQDPSTLVHHEILLPGAANTQFTEAGTLWNAAQAAERRKDAQEALEVVLALPNNPELDSRERLDLARSFAQEHWVSRGLAAQIDVHLPHSTNATEFRNMVEGGAQWHAHILVTTRRLEASGFAAHKARDLQPVIRTSRFGKPVVAEGELWGVAWRNHQNRYFDVHGKGIAVDPIAPIAQQHIGPIRHRHPDDPRIAANEEIRQANARLARDPQIVAEHLHAQAAESKRVERQTVARFLAKHIADPGERAATQAAAEEKLRSLQRQALERASWADKTQSGLRALSVEDIARELSPAYAELLKRGTELREQAAKEERSRNAMNLNKEAAAYRIEERWREMGVVRRAAHLVGMAIPINNILRDLELYRWERMLGGAAYMEDNKGIKQGAAQGELAKVNRLVEAMLDPNHPLGQELRPSGLTLRQEAERDLEQRQRQARNARSALHEYRQEFKVAQRHRLRHSL